LPNKGGGVSDLLINKKKYDLKMNADSKEIQFGLSGQKAKTLKSNGAIVDLMDK
jgi:hypothetical protein